MWGAIVAACAILGLSTLLTMLVQEEPLRETPPPLDWWPFVRIAAMTGLFTIVILGMGEAAKYAGRLLQGVAPSTGLLLAMGAVGVIAMTVAVIVGVGASIWISLGMNVARSNPSRTLSRAKGTLPPSLFNTVGKRRSIRSKVVNRRPQPPSVVSQ